VSFLYTVTGVNSISIDAVRWIRLNGLPYTPSYLSLFSLSICSYPSPPILTPRPPHSPHPLTAPILSSNSLDSSHFTPSVYIVTLPPCPSLTNSLSQSTCLPDWQSVCRFVPAPLTMLICLSICPPINLCVCLGARSLLNVPQLMKKGEAERKGRKLVELNLSVI
jgi:hypothetical protein